MSDGSEFQPGATATLKPGEGKVVQTREPTTDWCWSLENLQKYGKLPYSCKFCKLLQHHW